MAHLTIDTTKLLRWILLCLMSVLTFPAQSEFITDQIIIEVRSQRLLQGVVLQTLTRSSEVEVLSTDGGYSRVLTDDNVTGWIESKYLTDEQPIPLDNQSLITKTRELEEQLKAAESKLIVAADGGGEGIDIAEIEELRKRAADAGWMRVELKKARERANDIDTKMKTSGLNANNSQEELKKLRAQNVALQERLSASMLVSEQQGMAILEDGTSSTPTSQSSDHDWTVSIEWFFGSIVVALLIGLIAGMIWLDKRIRQRHGGFRIY